MGIEAEDINLLNFLAKVAPQSFPKAGKLTIPDVEFLKIAALLKLELAIRELK